MLMEFFFLWFVAVTLQNPYLRMDKGECVPYNSNSSNSTAYNSNNDNLKLIVGTTLSGILITALGIMVGIALYRNKWRRNRQGGANGSKDYSIITVPNTTNSRAFTLDEMVIATQNYNRKIGQGGFVSVFLGNLPEGKVIAVKVLSLFSKQRVREFLNEVDLLSKINHRNLVSLLGYCNETREVMLVYEYMSGGSLKDHLYGSSSEETELSWKTRLKIAMDAAQGLEYLHVGSTPKIIHRDIKSANILLDSNMNGKLADFGLSRMTIDGEATHVTTRVKGTFGYLDPEYYITQRLTEKSDVYSFGVVLLEIICGRPPIDLKLPEHELNIVRWVAHNSYLHFGVESNNKAYLQVTPYLLDMDENHVLEIDEIGGRIDKRWDDSYELKSITRVAKVAMRCVEAKPSLRPSVSEVVRELKKAMKIEEKVSISVAEDIDIKSVDLSVTSVTALSLSMDWRGRKGMEWSDDSSNPSNVGR
eukprot:PITA_16197